MSDNHARAPCPHCPNSEKLFTVPHGLRVHIGRKHRNLLRPPVTPPVADITSDEPSVLPRISLQALPALKSNVRVLRHIPKGARCLAAGKLTSIIDQCLLSNNSVDWLALLSFAYTALKLPDQHEKKSLTAKVKSNIEDGQIDVLPESSNFGAPSLYRSVESKVYEGDLRGAARLLTSDNTFAPPNEDTLAALIDKHPAPSRPLCMPRDTEVTTMPCISVKLEDVTRALQSFGRGSAAGLDGLRPDHIKEMTSQSAGDNGPRLLEAITRLCNFLLRGDLNPEVCPFLYGGSLCALQKKDGGVRPIAVGNTFRRLVAKLCCYSVKNSMAAYLQPHQIGFGSPLGCEAAIHATRAFVMREGSDDILIKVDIRNAFNSIERDVILSEVKELTPSIYRFLHQCYSTNSNLCYNDNCILSQVGAQQGDPLGPLIFSMAIHKAITALKAPLNIWYLDDGTIGGSPDVVERDVRSLFPALKELGLEVNTTKCEFYACSSAAAKCGTRFASLIPGLKIMSKETLNLLGAPIFREAVSDTMQAKTRILASLANHFKHLSAHVSLTLLRSCFALPKLAYVIRTAPTWEFPEEVLRFDDTLKRILEETLNVCLNDTQWCQASLPIRCGGLGVRRLCEVGPLAFLASSFGVAELVTCILSHYGDTTRIPFAADALEKWLVQNPGAVVPNKPECQRNWDNVSSMRVFKHLRDEASGSELARLNAASRPESGSWLHALPSPHMGTLLDNDSLRVATGLRLGCSICEPHICVCGSKVEANGHHALSCTRCAGRRPRHHAINEVIRRALVTAEVPCALEPPGLSRSDGKRPDGLTLVPWQRGRCLIWDATCVNTFAACHLPATQRAAGGGAESAAKVKRLKYATLELAYEFVPFAVETAGPWGFEAKKFISDLGRRMRNKGCDPRSHLYLAQHISLAIQRGNAASLMGTFGRCTDHAY